VQHELEPSLLTWLYTVLGHLDADAGV